MQTRQLAGLKSAWLRASRAPRCGINDLQHHSRRLTADASSRHHLSGASQPCPASPNNSVFFRKCGKTMFFSEKNTRERRENARKCRLLRGGNKGKCKDMQGTGNRHDRKAIGNEKATKGNWKGHEGERNEIMGSAGGLKGKQRTRKPKDTKGDVGKCLAMKEMDIHGK